MATRKLQASAPPLVFGGRSSSTSHSTEKLLQTIKKSLPGTKTCHAMQVGEPHFNSSCSVVVNGLKLLAVSCSPVQITACEDASTILMIPFSGNGIMHSEGKTIRWKAGSAAAWLPSCEIIDEGGARSALFINLDPNRIERVMRVMLGKNPDEQLPHERHEPRELLVQVGRVSFETIFRQFSSVIDQFILQPELLEYSGIDDNFYRNAAMMRYPELFLGEDESTLGTDFARRRLDRICQYIQANLAESITLTELERIGFMSRRNLHYAFQNRYDCTPMQWVRQERLTLAHSFLVMASVGTTVTDIAYKCGFAKSTTFSEYYNRRYGELPSATLNHALSR